MAGTIVVGVDGSEKSKEALRFALEEARLRGARVEAVYVADVAGDAAAVRVDQIAVDDRPARALIAAAADADLLVVGSRGHGGFAGLLLGSVSQQCAQHAPCPVVIVPKRP
jgi:nucleotide-binding universal stress UspA family protein